PRIAQRFPEIARDAVNHHAAVGVGLADGAENLFRMRIVEAQQTGFELLPVKGNCRIAHHGNHLDARLFDALFHTGVAGWIKMDAAGGGEALSGPCWIRWGTNVLDFSRDRENSFFNVAADTRLRPPCLAV